MFGWSSARTISRPLLGLLVRAVPLGCERIRTRRALDERCPVGGHHAARDAVDEHLEIRRQEIGHGAALVVHDGDVDRDDVDTGPESRWLLRRRRLAGGRPWSQRDAAEEHRQSCREVAVHRSDAAGIRYAVRARTPEWPFDFHLDASQRAITLRIRGGVAEQVLIGELLEQLGERVAELLDPVGEQRPAARRLRETAHHLFQRLERRASSLADHVERDVTREQPLLDFFEGRATALIFSVGEHDQGFAAAFVPQNIRGADDDVVQRRCPPGSELVDALDPVRHIGRAAREGEDTVVEAEHRHPVSRGYRPDELLRGFLQLRESRGHAAADIERHHEIERDVFRLKVRDRLWTLILPDAKGRSREASHVASIVCDGRRDLHDVHVLGFRVGEASRPHVVDDSGAICECRRHPDLVRLDPRARIPLALVWRAGHDAQLAAVHEEDDAWRGGRRLHARANHRPARHVLAIGGRDNRYPLRRQPGRAALRPSR